jgi:hypothetical protein
MKFLECDLEEIIMSVNDVKLSERGLHIGSKKKNQVRIGNYGVADIVSFHTPNWFFSRGEMVLIEKPKIQVIELKKDAVSLSSFIQAVGYLKGIQRYMDKVRNIDILDYNWEIVLIGKTVDFSSNLVYLPDLFDLEQNSIGVSIYTYEYEFDGLTFKPHHGYSLIKEGFNHE